MLAHVAHLSRRVAPVPTTATAAAGMWRTRGATEAAAIDMGGHAPAPGGKRPLASGGGNVTTRHRRLALTNSVRLRAHIWNTKMRCVSLSLRALGLADDSGGYVLSRQWWEFFNNARNTLRRRASAFLRGRRRAFVGMIRWRRCYVGSRRVFGAYRHRHRSGGQ